jgi:hypothetical protein
VRQTHHNVSVFDLKTGTFWTGSFKRVVDERAVILHIAENVHVSRCSFSSREGRTLNKMGSTLCLSIRVPHKLCDLFLSH